MTTPIHVDVLVDSYIAHPYWPEREQLIQITKESGMNRARSSANRRKALEQHLAGIGMNLQQFEQLEALADRPFYTDDEGFIIIPKKQVDGMLVAMCDTIRAAGRPCPPEMVRTVLRASDWRSLDLKPSDAKTWQRYAVVSAGTGARLSNQRALRVNEYVGANPPEGEPTSPFLVSGTFTLNEEMVRPDVLRKALEWAGQWVGIGASRKMGWGRFTIGGFHHVTD